MSKDNLNHGKDPGRHGKDPARHVCLRVCMWGGPCCLFVSPPPPPLQAPAPLGMLVQGSSNPLYVAAENGQLEVVKALLAADAYMEPANAVSGTHAASHVCTRMCLMSLRIQAASSLKSCPCP